MSNPITVKAGTRAAFSINAQSLLVVVFLGILAYVLLAGGGKDERANASQHGQQSQDPPERPNVRVPDTPVSGIFESNPQSPSYDNSQSPAVYSGNTPLTSPHEELDSRYDRPTLRPLKPNAPHTPIIRTPSSQRRGSIRFADDAELAKTQTDRMIRGDGAMDEEDYHAWNEAAISQGVRTPASPKAPNREKRQKIHQDLSKLRANAMFAGFVLRPGVIERLIEIEDIAIQDNRGMKLPMIPRGKNVKPGIKPEQSDIESWDDPYADEWDDVWGPLPALAYEAAIRVAEIIQATDIIKLQALMREREVASVQDQKRSWSRFLERTIPKGKSIDPIRIAVGWFADTFRAVDHRTRMSISDRFVDMKAQLPLIANALQWLEAIAMHFRRQRLFSDTGLDLDGLSLRLAILTRTVGTGKAQTIQYELELHFFMWGGPTDDGEDTMEKWAERLARQSQPSLRCAVTDLAYTLHTLGESQSVMTLCRRRSVIFRPGYSAHGVSQSSFAVDKSIALREPFSRKPIVVEYPADAWAALGGCDFDYYIRNIFACVYPSEAGIFNSRQYQWDKTTLTDENNRLNSLHLLAILRCIGPALEPETNIAAHTIEFIDFGCFIPLLVFDNDKGQRVSHFFPLSDMRTVAGICVPFLSAQTPPRAGETVRLLLDETYGLRSQLVTRYDGSNIGTTKEGLTVFVTTTNTTDAELFRKEIIGYLQDQARLLIKSQVNDDAPKEDQNAARRLARERMKAWIESFISHVCVVDESKSNDANKLYGVIEPEPMIVSDPSEWPAEFQDI